MFAIVELMSRALGVAKILKHTLVRKEISNSCFAIQNAEKRGMLMCGANGTSGKTSREGVLLKFWVQVQYRLQTANHKTLLTKY